MLVRPSKKSEMVSVLFSEILWSGGKFLFFFDTEVLMLKYTFLLLKYRRYCIQLPIVSNINSILERRKQKFSDFSDN